MHERSLTKPPHARQVEMHMPAFETKFLTLCSHCSGRFEREGRELVNFLKNLLGNHIIQTNLVLVVTKISQSKAAERDRQHENKPVDVLMAEYQNVVQQEFGLQTGLPVIDIDTCPVSFRIHILPGVNTK